MIARSGGPDGAVGWVFSMIEQPGPTFPLTTTDELYETAFRASVRGDHDLAIARTPAPASRPRPSHAPTAERTDDLLSMTPLGREALRLREDREREAARRKPAPIGADVRRDLAATHTGRSVLVERARLDPTGEGQAAGLDPARRRELLEASTLGRSLLREEAHRD